MKLPSVPVRIVAAATLLALGLVGVVVREGMARAQGQEVRLAITGYDPRALLTGHYVQFQLVDEVSPEGVCARKADQIEFAAPAWFAVRREGGAHRIVAGAASRAAALRQGEAAIRGHATCLGVAWTRPDGRRTQSPLTVAIDIGVDRIHVEQDEAEALETALRGLDGPPPASWAVLSVDGAGKARLKGLIVGERRVDLDWF